MHLNPGTEEDQISLEFTIPAENDRLATSNIILSFTEDSVVFEGPEGVFSRESEFDKYNSPLTLLINQKGYFLGNFQFASRFKISDETLIVQKGTALKVITY